MNQREIVSDFETIIGFGLFLKKLNMELGSWFSSCVEL
jgi:hypothetical protein